jgi:acetoin utilization protein AcuC
MLLVYGPRSMSYDFGPGHPLTPRRFGPGIGLLQAVGAGPGLAPEPATDEELEWCHTRRYIEVVKRFSRDPYGMPESGIGEGGDDPPFPGMHVAGAAVAGGSLQAVEAILRGDVAHAFHPGGGLHHAMPDRASGFCIYDDPALAISRARREGLRVLYLDFDVHHGDGVQAIHWADPDVLTLSFHESGRYLFPGTGGVGELGEGVAAGTSVNVPLEPETGEGAWSAAVRMLLPELAAAFGPDIVVSQHGADSHAWDPLAHLRVTTTAMGEAARLVDLLAHRFAGGRWLATGGGGYDAYRVVPRTWSLVWLAGAHREVPVATPVEWRDRWASDGARYGQAPLPATFEDAPNAGLELDASQAAAEVRSLETAGLVRRLVVPRLLQVARDRGWWDPVAVGSEAESASGTRSGSGAGSGAASSTRGGLPSILGSVDASTWERLGLAPRVVAPADPVAGHALVLAAIRAGAIVSAAVEGSVVVGLAIVGPIEADRRRELLAVGVAPSHRRRGLAGTLLTASTANRPHEIEMVAEVTLAERDPVEPLDRATRARVAGRLLQRAGFDMRPAAPDLHLADPDGFAAVRELHR